MKMKNIIIILFILLSFSLAVGSVNAENQTTVIDRNNNSGLLEANVNGDDYSGVCLNQSKGFPTNDQYDVVNGSGGVPEKTKNIIIKYYRDNSSNRYKQLIQYAVWSSLIGRNTTYEDVTASERLIVEQMLADQSGVVGNTYTDANGITYVFQFKYGTPSYVDKQDALLFRYETRNESGKNPSIGTSARNNATGNRTGISNGLVTIVDRVTYNNLTIGSEYTITGYLMYKNGSYVRYNGNLVSASKTFNVTASNGSIELSFVFDASGLGNFSVVVFEFLSYSNGTNLTNHTDLNDSNQTVSFNEEPEEPNKPTIGTNAKDKETGSKNPSAGGMITIVDTVNYNNLIIGKTYTIKGILMDKNTGNALLVNGKTVTAEITFVADKTNGTKDLEFTFDSSALAGKTIVVFEKLLENNTEIAVHEDINDENQTLTFKPKKPETPETPDVPETPNTPNTPNVPETPDTPTPNASMKSTGVQIFVVILVLLSSLSLIIRKN